MKKLAILLSLALLVGAGSVYANDESVSESSGWDSSEGSEAVEAAQPAPEESAPAESYGGDSLPTYDSED